MNIPKGFTIALSEAYGTLLKCEKDHPLFVPVDGKVPDACHHCTYEASRTPPALEWCSRCGCGSDRYAHLESCPTNTPPAQEADNNGEDLTKFYILRKPGFVPRVCRPMGDDLAANLRDWFKHHPGATIDIVKVRLIDGCVSDLWVDDGIEYLQILDDGGWIPGRTARSDDQEAEPVYQFRSAGDIWHDVSEDTFRYYSLHGFETRMFYTRPANDKLKQAARTLLKVLNEGGNLAKAMQDLDAELERKS